MSNLEVNRNIKLDELMSNIALITDKVVQIVLDLSNSLLIPTMNMFKTIANTLQSQDFISQNPALQENIKNLVKTQENLLNSLIGFSNYVSNVLSNLINNFMASFDQNSIITYFNKFINYVKEIISRVLGILKQIFNIQFLDALLKFVETFMNNLSSNINKISNSGGSISDMLKLMLDQDFIAFINIISPIAKALGQSMRSINIEKQENNQKVSDNSKS
ncbi:hypothetical protein Calag_0518 [Caldisphaera lagunensis DSM 15908]|uniref:Uncharacterized protein n=1 Tax=Caldisphaera lagunensis (strain DSM 15908 / JCM 11604 / ANMR 0165 / IC-154) TaxID=1056495 RepID=L0AAX8_CALLD|nr:hypothetical protein [Caldisphaera lagunensis]AFZ70282.1 hypothetical protein Calag_0518 [Caldisphaera lagunensis DSM 15908]